MEGRREGVHTHVYGRCGMLHESARERTLACIHGHAPTRTRPSGAWQEERARARREDELQREKLERRRLEDQVSHPRVQRRVRT
jgi:hypothetical protein